MIGLRETEYMLLEIVKSIGFIEKSLLYLEQYIYQNQ